MKTIKQFLKKLINNVFPNKPLAKQICNNITQPKHHYKDVSWVEVDVTPDQLRIEAVLTELNLENKTILHVGVGRSNIAVKFITSTIKIDGITIMQEEKEHADSLVLQNYHVYLMNKYSNELKELEHHYDFIVDNNLSSFACCKQHYHLMMSNYIELLNKGGIILTDKMGMNYHEDYAFGIEYKDLQELENQFPVKALQLSDFVFAIQKL